MVTSSFRTVSSLLQKYLQFRSLRQQELTRCLFFFLSVDFTGLPPLILVMTVYAVNSVAVDLECVESVATPVVVLATPVVVGAASIVIATVPFAWSRLRNVLLM